MSHPHELLLAYIDGELAESDERRVEEHLASCASCTAEVDALLAARTAILTRDQGEPSTGFADRAASRAAASRRGWSHLSAARAAGLAALWLVSVLGSAALGARVAQRGAASAAPPGGAQGATTSGAPPGATVVAAADSAQYLLVLFEADTMWPPRPGSVRTGYAEWNRRLAAEGRVVASEKLTDERGAIVAPGGRLLAVSSAVTPAADVPAGPLVSGFFIVRAADDTTAVAIARESPHLRYGGSILVRRIE